jgi:hypothetical protein
MGLTMSPRQAVGKAGRDPVRACGHHRTVSESTLTGIAAAASKGTTHISAVEAGPVCYLLR